MSPPPANSLGCLLNLCLSVNDKCHSEENRNEHICVPGRNLGQHLEYRTKQEVCSSENNDDDEEHNGRHIAPLVAHSSFAQIVKRTGSDVANVTGGAVFNKHR